MPSEGPENLLKSALEKVVYFECRIEQLEADVASASGERDRLKGELSLASVRELQLKQELSALQARYLATRREVDDAHARIESLRAERERWLTSMASATRIRQAGELPEGEIDLASFISELRAEVSELRAGKPVERTLTERHSPRDASELAQGMAESGRIGFTESDRKELVKSARFETRAEETVFAFSLRELSSPLPESRTRAAQRLAALKSREAAAALAAALNAEEETAVKPALIDALAATGGAEAIALLSPHLRDRDVSVRLAALEASVKLAGPSATREVERALADESPRMRRRAALLAGAMGPEAGAPLLSQATADADASVRRVAALALAAFGGETARTALLAAADDADHGVRRAAWQGLSRLFHEPLLSLADEPSPRRRRELRRLEATPLAPPTAEERRPLVELASAALGVEPKLDPQPEAHVEAAPEPEPAIDAALAEQLIAEVATSLRGRSMAELAQLAPEPAVAQTAAALLGQGRLVRRNQRFFLA